MLVTNAGGHTGHRLAVSFCCHILYIIFPVLCVFTQCADQPQCSLRSSFQVVVGCLRGFLIHFLSAVSLGEESIAYLSHLPWITSSCNFKRLFHFYILLSRDVLANEKRLDGQAICKVVEKLLHVSHDMKHVFEADELKESMGCSTSFLEIWFLSLNRKKVYSFFKSSAQFLDWFPSLFSSSKGI